MTAINPKVVWNALTNLLNTQEVDVEPTTDEKNIGASNNTTNEKKDRTIGPKHIMIVLVCVMIFFGLFDWILRLVAIGLILHLSSFEIHNVPDMLGKIKKMSKTN